MVCYRAERVKTMSCQNSVFQLCETYGIQKACDYQLHRPASWKRGTSVQESCKRNQPPAQYTAIGTFLEENEYYPFNHRLAHFQPHTALFLACGAWNSIIVLDQHTDNRTFSVWGTNVLMDKGNDVSEYNARMYYTIEEPRRYK